MVMIASVTPVIAADDSNRASTTAAYGTPVIDGEIDSVWDKTSYNQINIIKNVGNGNEYNGWFKVLWDENNLYVLAKVYTHHFIDYNTNPWDNDSFEVFIDEDCARTTKYMEDDFQLRSDFKGEVSGQNYDLEKLNAAGKTVENAFIVEMGFPLKTAAPTENMQLGFDIQVNRAKAVGFDKVLFGWNPYSRVGSVSASTALFGTLTLKKSVVFQPFNEPNWIKPSITNGYSEKEEPVKYELIKTITTTFDDNSFNYPILLADGYPLMEIGEFADVIGGEVKGNTLSKGDIALTFEAGNRLAEYNNAHLMLEREPAVKDGRLYVPVSSVQPTFCYGFEFNRYGDSLAITSGTNYPAIEKYFYVKDYGAKGDGVTDDKEAILNAFNAAMTCAINGTPSELVFESNKTYRVSERNDRWEFFDIYNVKNFTVEGNDSTILFDTPTNKFCIIQSCTNVKFKNLAAAFKEYTSTYGVIKEINNEEGYFIIDINDGSTKPAPQEWVDAHGYKWDFTQLVNSEDDHPKMNVTDVLFIEGVHKAQGSSYKLDESDDYKVVIAQNSRVNMKYAEIGDRLALRSGLLSYDLSNTSKDGSIMGIEVLYSSDILIEGVDLYGSIYFGMAIGGCTGRVTIRDFGLKRKDGELMASNSDGIRSWRCRQGITIENSVLYYNLDDHMNTTGKGSEITDKIDEYTYKVVEGLNWRQGDEIKFYNASNRQLLGSAFITSCNTNHAGGTIVVDRKIEGVLSKNDDKVSQPTIAYNINTSAKGSVVRNNEFIGSRRHGYISRSTNSIFEGNKVLDCGGCAIEAADETGAGFNEGPFPSSFTIRNNYIEGSDGNTIGNYPINVMVWGGSLGSSAAIDGVLIENNTVNVANKNRMISVSHAKDLYMLNNTLVCEEGLQKSTLPVVIVNSEIKQLDGLKYDSPQEVEAVVTIAGCKVDEKGLKNIDIKEGNKSQPYIIY